MIPPNLASCSFWRATRSVVANFLVEAAGSGDDSMRSLTSVRAMEWDSKNSRLKQDSWSAPGRSPSTSVRKSISGVSSVCWGE